MSARDRLLSYAEGRLTNICLILFLLTVKVIYTLNIDAFGWDGSYYYGIARNIKNGLGFTTNLSLYHQGMTYFPHPTPVYPLWPTLLGYISYFFSLEITAYLFPFLLFFATLIIAYRLIQKLHPENIVNTKYFTLNYAHVGVLIFFLHGKYFEATSKPYTEALAYLLLWIALTRLNSIISSTKVTTFLEIGAWSAILILVRSQFIIFLMSIIFFYLVVLLSTRSIKYFWGILIITVSFFTVYTPQFFFLSENLGQLNQATLLFFDQYQASNVLSKLNVLVGYESIFKFLYYKFYGLGVAFLPWGKYSYSMTFHGFQYSFILMVFVIPIAYASPKNRKLLYHNIRDLVTLLEKRFFLFFIIFSLASFFSIHMLHKNLWDTWNFATRHALMCSFLFFLSFFYLFKQVFYPRVRRVALSIFLLAVVIGMSNLIIQTVNQVYSSSFYEKRNELIQWLKSKRSNQLSFSVAMPDPQKISVYTEGVNFHWIYYNTSKKDFEALFMKLGVDYLLLPENDYGEFLKKIPDFDRLFIKSKKMLSGYFVLSPSAKLLSLNQEP